MASTGTGKTLLGALLGFAGMAFIKRATNSTYLQGGQPSSGVGGLSPVIINVSQLAIGIGIAHYGDKTPFVKAMGLGVSGEAVAELVIKQNPITWGQAKFKGITPGMQVVPPVQGGAYVPVVNSGSNVALQKATTTTNTAGNLINAGTNDINSLAQTAAAVNNLLNAAKQGGAAAAPSSFAPSPTIYNNNVANDSDDDDSDDDGMGSVPFNASWN